MEKNSLKAALLPLYLELYDQVRPDNRETARSFAAAIATALKSKGLEIVELPICRLKDEFSAAVAKAEEEKVDALITLHLAYSPSLESAEALAATELPLIVLDTTPDYEFHPGTEPGRLLLNHGIHGVQDMCNLLIRNGKSFLIEAGHWLESDVIDRTANAVKAAKLAVAMRNARVGRIGESFAGMGDFTVADEIMRDKLGVSVVKTSASELADRYWPPEDSAIDAEMALDSERFDISGVSNDGRRLSVAVGLAVRGWLESENLDGFSVNFMGIDRKSGLPAVPFLEASKAMARGLGYAGEGDVLTAALVGALAQVYPRTSFTEMFCPNWKEDSVFLNHMGEMNHLLAVGKARLHERKWIFTDAADPVYPVGKFKPGEAVFVNLAPGPDASFTLIAAPVSVLPISGEDKFVNSVRGWIKPRLGVARFLEEYSAYGGTHHAAILYPDDEVEQAVETLAGFACLMGMDMAVIG